MINIKNDMGYSLFMLFMNQLKLYSITGPNIRIYVLIELTGHLIHNNAGKGERYVI